jgi:hypothetical protein
VGNYYAPFSLRIPEALLEKIKRIAAENQRSANREITFVLENYVREYERTHGAIETNETE